MELLEISPRIYLPTNSLAALNQIGEIDHYQAEFSNQKIPKVKKQNISCSFTIACIGVFLFPNCASEKLENRLSSARFASSQDTLELIEANQSHNTTSLSWKQALAILTERNIILKRSRLRNEDLIRARDEQWKTWLPRLGFYSNLQTSLAELGSLSFSDINTALVAPLIIPNPFTEQAQAIENSLACLESEESLELTRRRQTITLYRIFERFERAANVEARMSTVKDKTSVQLELSKLETQASQQESLNAARGEFAQFLNLPGSQLIPLSSTRPKIDYETKIDHLTPGRNYGHLAVRLSAYQIVGALLSEKGIKLQKWPSFSLSGSSPTVYDSRSDDSIGNISSEQISLFGGLSKTYEFTGSEADRVRTAEENTAFVKENLRLRLDQETREWLRLKQRYQQLLTKRKLANERLAAIQSQQSGGSAAATIIMLRSAFRSLEAVDQAKEQLDLEIWLWDDEKWK